MKTIIASFLSTLLFVIPTAKYVHSKTLGRGQTDCMIEYVDKYYPTGSMYLIKNKFLHIDKPGIENDLMKNIGYADGCIIHSSPVISLLNTPYCYITLFFEKGIGIPNSYAPDN